jgi:hypothetical protein
MMLLTAPRPNTPNTTKCLYCQGLGMACHRASTLHRQIHETLVLRLPQGVNLSSPKYCRIDSLERNCRPSIS